MDYILYEQNGNVATITINREKALNALNSQVLDELLSLIHISTGFRKNWTNVRQCSAISYGMRIRLIS